MEPAIIVFAFVLIALALVGSFLPVLPGPPLAYLAMPLVHFFTPYTFSHTVLISYLILALVITVLDYAIPAWAVAKAGGSKSGSTGSLIGMMIGFFFIPAIGVFVGAFVGAMVGELRAGRNFFEALAAGWWSFVGFLAGSLIKFFYCMAVGVHLAIMLIRA